MTDSLSTPNQPPSSGALSAAGRLVVRHRRDFLIRKVAGLCRRYLDWYGNLSYDMATNGEAFILHTLAGFQFKVIFDVGANVGEWTATARKSCSQAEIHCFEISPPTFAKLVANTQSLGNVFCHNIGLSDKADSIRLRHYNDFPALTTNTDYPHPFSYSEITAAVTSGDEYSAAHQICHIDLLKIDVEGMEEQVLRGFQQMFDRQAIDLVQFEYGQVNIVNRFLLRDAYRFFRERGYVVGKVFPSYVDFRDYNFRDEDFIGPNYLACREERPDYIHALSGAEVCPLPRDKTLVEPLAGSRAYTDDIDSRRVSDERKVRYFGPAVECHHSDL